MNHPLSNTRVVHLKNGMTGVTGEVESDGYVPVSWDMQFSDNGDFSRLTNGARVEDLEQLIDWDSRSLQTILIPGARWGILNKVQPNYLARVRREAKRRGLRVTCCIAGGVQSAHVRILGEVL